RPVDDELVAVPPRKRFRELEPPEPAVCSLEAGGKEIPAVQLRREVDVSGRIIMMRKDNPALFAPGRREGGRIRPVRFGSSRFDRASRAKDPVALSLDWRPGNRLSRLDEETLDGRRRHFGRKLEHLRDQGGDDGSRK